MRENLEKRSLNRLPEIETREDGKRVMRGYAAVWESLSGNLGGFRERIKPGAFASAIAKGNTVCLRDHDSSKVLGSVDNGTLILTEDETGLRFEAILPDTQEARDSEVLVRDKYVKGCSFQFTTEKDEWENTSEGRVRTLVQIRELFDVGPVTFPAYPDTSVAMRSLASVDRNSASELETLNIRLRLAENSIY